jgi:hypothetical protein
MSSNSIFRRSSPPPVNIELTSPERSLHQPNIERMLETKYTVTERLITRRAEAKTVAEHRADIAREILGAKHEQIRIARQTAESRWRAEAAAFLAAYAGETHRRLATQLEGIQAALVQDMGDAEQRFLQEMGNAIEKIVELPEAFRDLQERRLMERVERHLQFISEDLLADAYERLRSIRRAFPLTTAG